MSINQLFSALLGRREWGHRPDPRHAWSRTLPWAGLSSCRRLRCCKVCGTRATFGLLPRHPLLSVWMNNTLLLGLKH